MGERGGNSLSFFSRIMGRMEKGGGILLLDIETAVGLPD
ncbi:hypothetical protein LEP1GSC061_0441 [Leptospira wolffii serovar Khorat str. Khorat-H2]|nr:hypothetical protein LEP1GSC061_0441 [Leptospira wolffii serovar Khorat str. Khorat-H2]